MKMWFSALQLDAAAPVLANLKEPIVIAKVDADKHTRLARKYDVEYVFFGPTI
jgi:protein disulfide-isomerase A1